MPRNYSRYTTTQSRHPSRRRLPLAAMLVVDVLAAAALLGVFYITNYMIPVQIEPVNLPAPSSVKLQSAAPTATAKQAQSPASEANATTAPTEVPQSQTWKQKFADKFTDGPVQKTENRYRSANISVEIKTLSKFDVTCYVADIYVADLKYFRTAFAKKADIMGDRELTDKVAAENGAVVAINGDHCLDNPGTVVRNGKLYRQEKSSADVLVMNYDGSMQCYAPDSFDMEKIKKNGAYQVWCFGPILLQKGQPSTEFNSTLLSSNPRTAIGYYEPGHYCFVVVGGRQANNYSQGYTMQQLSQVMVELGCQQAYNLDGGRSSEMIFLGKMMNQQSGGRRSTPDILYIADNERTQ